jgi:hypothetical protein
LNHTVASTRPAFRYQREVQLPDDIVNMTYMLILIPDTFLQVGALAGNRIEDMTRGVTACNFGEAKPQKIP